MCDHIILMDTWSNSVSYFQGQAYSLKRNGWTYIVLKIPAPCGAFTGQMEWKDKTWSPWHLCLRGLLAPLSFVGTGLGLLRVPCLLGHFSYTFKWEDLFFGNLLIFFFSPPVAKNVKHFCFSCASDEESWYSFLRQTSQHAVFRGAWSSGLGFIMWPFCATVFSVVKWRSWLTHPSSALDLLCCDLGVQNISLTTLFTEALGFLSGMPYIAQKAELRTQKGYIETVSTQKTKWETGEWHNHSSYRFLPFT